jgi:hypothetical protein
MFFQSPDQEVAVLTVATLANILSYSDTILLTNLVVLESLGAAMPVLIETVRHVQKLKPQRFYAVAAVANASSHPRLASLLNQNGGDTLLNLYQSLWMSIRFIYQEHVYGDAIFMSSAAISLVPFLYDPINLIQVLRSSASLNDKVWPTCISSAAGRVTAPAQRCTI